MKANITTATALPPAVLGPILGPVGKAFEEVSASFDRFCLAAGIAALGEIMEKGRSRGLRNSSFARQRAPRLSLGSHAGQDRLSRWQN